MAEAQRMKQYIIKQANPLGEFDNKYGQRYWAHVEDSDYEVSFNLMHPINFEKGDVIEYEEKLLKESKSGREYLQLRKVKKLGGPQTDVSSPSSVNAPLSKAAADNKYLKDTSDIPYRVWKDLLPYIDVRHLWDKPDYNRLVNEYVMEQSNEILSMIDNIRSGAGDIKSTLKVSPIPALKEEETPAAEPKYKQEHEDLKGIERARATRNEIGAKQMTSEEAAEFLGGLDE